MIRSRIPNDYTSSISHLVFDKTGQFMISASADGSFSVHNMHPQRTLYKHQFSCRVVSFAWLSSEPTGSVACGLDSGSITVCTFATNVDDVVGRSFIVLVESAHLIPGGTCMDYFEGPSTAGALSEFYHGSGISFCLSLRCLSLELM